MPTPKDYRGAWTTFSDDNRRDHDLFDLFCLRRKEHHNPGNISSNTGTFGRYGYLKSFAGSNMNCRHFGAGIVSRIVPGKGMDNVRTQRDPDRRLPDTFCDSIKRGP